MSGIINGASYFLKINDKTILFGTAAGFNVEHNLKNITVRESFNWKTNLPGSRGWNMEFEGKLAYQYVDGSTPAWNKLTIDDVVSLGIINQSRVWLKMESVDGGTYYWHGLAYITGIQVEAPNEANTSMNISFQGVNELSMNYKA
jgi:hypothetical protein